MATVYAPDDRSAREIENLLAQNGYDCTKTGKNLSGEVGLSVIPSASRKGRSTRAPLRSNLSIVERIEGAGGRVVW